MKHRFLAGLIAGITVGASLSAIAAVLLLGGPDAAPPVVIERVYEGSPKDAEERCDVDRGALDTCEDTLARLRVAYNNAGHEDNDEEAMVDVLEDLLVKSGGAAPEGTPMSFPEWLPDHFSPQGFAQAVSEIQRDCPGVIPDDATINCDEFPCLISAQTSKPPDWGSFKGCKAWARYFGNDMGLKMQRISPPGDEPIHTLTLSPQPRDDADEVKNYVEEYKGNLDKRLNRRRDDVYIDQVVRYNSESCEESGDSGACFRIGSALRERDPEEAHTYLSKSCEGGHGNACNNAAWFRCHDDGVCDDETLKQAEEAARLRDWDGQGALDTLGYILCQRGQVQEANAAYQRSCSAGYQQNCTKVCGGS